VAHGASRGVEGHPTASFSPGGATERSAPGLSPLPGLGRLAAHGVPRLAPWATFCRRSAALAALQTLGLRLAFHPRLLNWLPSGGHPAARVEASPSGEHELPA